MSFNGTKRACRSMLAMSVLGEQWKTYARMELFPVLTDPERTSKLGICLI